MMTAPDTLLAYLRSGTSLHQRRGVSPLVTTLRAPQISNGLIFQFRSFFPRRCLRERYELAALRGTETQNLDPILIFTTVAEMGSFTRAADNLGIQKGRASMAVRKLEEDVGVRLLHRTTRSAQLTEDGRAFHARDLLAEVDDLHSMFAGDRVALRRRLSVFKPVTPSARFDRHRE
jgi:molybdenum-dependent DNA-binding transcriptional regulator ModE